MNKNLGCLPTPLDLRDIQLTQAVAPLPHPIAYQTDISGLQSLFQNGFGTCVAHAGAFFAMILDNLDTGIKQALSPRFLWDELKIIDNIPPEDGSNIRFACKSLQSKGVCRYDLLPNPDYSQTTLYDYTTYRNITPEMEADAEPRVIQSYAFLDNLSFEGIKSAIYNHKAVLLRLGCDDGFFNTDTPVIQKTPYGHLVTAFGYDAQFIYIKDSTEIDHPIKKMDFNASKFFTDGATAIDIPNDVVKKLIAKRALLQKLVSLYQALLKLLGK